MSLYQISKNNTVVSFNQNQKAPNKVGDILAEKMKELVIAGTPFEETKTILSEMHENFQKESMRGIASVDIKTHEDSEFERVQPHKCIYLSYKLNGSFATFTEYMPIRKEIGRSEQGC